MKIDLSDEIEQIRNQTEYTGEGSEIPENIEKLLQHADQYYAEQDRKYAEQNAQAEIDRKKQLRHDWMVAIIGGIIGATTGVILTLIIQHL